MLIDMGFSAVAIADRVGHESIDITYRYGNFLPGARMEKVELHQVYRALDMIAENSDIESRALVRLGD